MSHRIGLYRLERILENGGVGTVYLAHEESSGRMADVTVLGPGWAAGSGERDLLRAALRVRAEVRHPSLAAVYGTAEDRDRFAIAEEHLAGRPLDRMEEEQGAEPIAPGAAIEILVPVLDGLGYLHDRAIVHRAVHPGNIVIGGGGVRLRGLGVTAIAEIFPDEARRISLAPRAYLSPEQLGRSAGDLHTDIYSSAVVLYRLLAGRLSLEDDDGWERGHIVDPPALQILVPSVPAGVSAAVAIAMRADPRRRFHSADAFRQALVEGMVGFLPIPPDAPAEPPSRDSARPAASSEPAAAGPSPAAWMEMPRRAPDWQPRAAAAAACLVVAGGLLWLETAQQDQPRLSAPGPSLPYVRPAPAPEAESSEPPPAEPPAEPALRLSSRGGAVAGRARQAAPQASPASEPPRDPKPSPGEVLAAQQAALERRRAEARQEIARIGAALDARELAGLPQRLDALAGALGRDPAEMQAEREELQSLRHRLIETQIQEAGWRARIEEIRRLVERGKYAEADGLAADLSKEPGVSEAISTQARQLSDQAREEIQRVWKDIRLGPTQNSLDTRKGKPPRRERS